MSETPRGGPREGREKKESDLEKAKGSIVETFRNEGYEAGKERLRAFYDENKDNEALVIPVLAEVILDLRTDFDHQGIVNKTNDILWGGALPSVENMKDLARTIGACVDELENKYSPNLMAELVMEAHALRKDFKEELE